MQKFPVGMTPHSAGNRQKFRPALAILSIDLSTVLTTVLKVLCAVLIADLTVALISVLKILSAVLAIALPTGATVYVLERGHVQISRESQRYTCPRPVGEKDTCKLREDRSGTCPRERGTCKLREDRNNTCPLPRGRDSDYCPDYCFDNCPEDLKILGIAVTTV